MRPSIARQRMDMSAARTSSLPQNVLPSLNELKEAVFPNSRKNDIGAKCWSLFLSQGGARSTRGRARAFLHLSCDLSVRQKKSVMGTQSLATTVSVCCGFILLVSSPVCIYYSHFSFLDNFEATLSDKVLRYGLQT